MQYALFLWLQTLAGLALLALIGGWTLNLFCQKGRPWNGLTAPVAGMAIFSVAMTIACRGFGLPVQMGLLLTTTATIPSTIILLLRRRWPAQLRRAGLTPWLLILLVTAWSTFTCNRASIDTGEPTILTRDGTDMVGYAQMADWFLTRPGQIPEWNPERPEQAFTSLLYQSDPRWGTFLLLSTAAWMRGTTALMSYDFLSGIVLAAGVLALAGTYASRRTTLWLLTAAGMLSLWFSISRAGYLGKLAAYPGCLWLCALYFAAAEKPSWSRWLLLMLLAAGVSLSHALPALLCMLGLAAFPATGLAAWSAFARIAAPDPLRARVLRVARTGLRYGSLYALMCLPLVLVYRALQIRILVGQSMVVFPWPVERICRAALGLDGLCFTAIEGLPSMTLLAATGVTHIGLALIAWRQRSLPAGSLLAAITVLTWTAHPQYRWHVYQIQGILFPMSIAAAAILLDGAASRAGRRQFWVCLSLTAIAIGLRGPQAAFSWDRYRNASLSPDFRYEHSEIQSLSELAQGRTVRLATTTVHPGLVLMAEFTARNQQLQYSSSAWSCLFRYTGWPAPDYPDDPELLICSIKQAVLKDSVLATTDRYRILDSSRFVTLFPVEIPHNLELDQEGRDVYWQGAKPSRWEALNYTGQTAVRYLSANLKRGPNHPVDQELTFQVINAGQTSTQFLPLASEWKLEIPVVIPPGRHEISLAPLKPKVTLTVGEARDRILLVRELGLREAHDEQVVNLLPTQVPLRLEKDAAGEPIFWQGAQPTRLELINGTGKTHGILLQAETPRGPNLADPAQGKVQIRTLGNTVTHDVRALERWQLKSYLLVPPGRHEMQLWSDDPALPLPDSPDRRDRLFLVRKLSVEPVEPQVVMNLSPGNFPHGLERDADKSPIFWQGAQPSVVEIWNPWPGPMDVVFSAQAPRGPNHPECPEGRLEWTFDDHRSSLVVKATEQWRFQIPLTVRTGRHQLKIWTEQAPVEAAYGKDPRDRLFLVRKILLEPSAPPADPLQTPAIARDPDAAPR